MKRFLAAIKNIEFLQDQNGKKIQNEFLSGKKCYALTKMT